MKHTHLFNKVVTIVADQFGWNVKDIKRDTEFIYDLSADESDLNELALAIEEEFDVDVFDIIQNLIAVDDLVDHIEENM